MKRNDKQPEIADIFRTYGKEYRQNNALSYEQRKVMRHLEVCRTAELGGHIEACNHCGFERNAYNSCRDRHCPKCQTLVKEKWLNDRKAELLPCGYFHNVFTLPHEFNPLILANMQVMQAILFAAVNETLQVFARDPQWRLVGQLGLYRRAPYMEPETHGSFPSSLRHSRQEYFHLTRKNGLPPGKIICSKLNRWPRNSKNAI